MLRVSLIIALSLILAACAKTTVTKNPDECDSGIRYYRPKPYLLIQPADSTSDEQVSISLEYLPDFSEEYSIHVRAGLGVNETKITLKDGWNLTRIDQKVDSQFDENVEAFADLIGKLPIPTAGKARKSSEMKMIVKATNVPLGFYEAVVSEGKDGKKRLYGWRYVGFYPFNAYPRESSGLDIGDCHALDVYGLVFDRGVMTFKSIGLVESSADHRRERIDRGLVGRLPPVEEIDAPALSQVRERALVYIQMTAWGGGLSPQAVSVQRRGTRTITVTVKLTPPQFQHVMASFPTAASKLESKLLPDVRSALLDKNHQVDVQFVQ